MHEGVRARVEVDDELKATEGNQDGEVAAGDATFRFSVDRSGQRADSRHDTDADSSSGAGADEEKRTDDEDADDPQYVAPLEEVPTNGTIRCEALGGRHDSAVEFVLRRDGEEAFAWRNSCPHEPDVRLDPGWGALIRDDRIVCHEHGARFECGDGLCTYGPCRGKTLDPISVAVRDGEVYLTDDRFEACRRLS